jgi:hypothetical protein
MQAANKLFSTFIAEISSQFTGRLISTELEGGKLADIFDKYAGIDAIHVWRDKVRGVAVRVQWGFNYKTFTIRYKRRSGVVTEYAKRLDAIRGGDGALYPYLTIQAYAEKRDGGRLLSYAVVVTEDLYDYIEKHLPETERHIEMNYHKKDAAVGWNVCPEGNTFLIVDFGKLGTSGIRHIMRDFENDTINTRQHESTAYGHPV